MILTWSHQNRCRWPSLVGIENFWHPSCGDINIAYLLNIRACTFTGMKISAYFQVLWFTPIFQVGHLCEGQGETDPVGSKTKWHWCETQKMHLPSRRTSSWKGTPTIVWVNMFKPNEIGCTHANKIFFKCMTAWKFAPWLIIRTKNAAEMRMMVERG